MWSNFSIQRSVFNTCSNFSTVAIIHFVLTLAFMNGFHGFHRNIRRRAIGRAVGRRTGVFRWRENRVRKATGEGKGTRGGQSSQSLGHSQCGSLWCNRDAEAPCFCAFGERSRPSDKPASIPPYLLLPTHLSLAGSWTISRSIFSV